MSNIQKAIAINRRNYMRGDEERYSDEIEKLTGLKKCEKDALMWLVGNELFSETR